MIIFALNMRNLKGLNIKESIRERKLVYSKRWYDYADAFTLLLFCSAWTYFTIILFKSLDPKSPNDLFVISVIIPIIILCNIYIIYRVIADEHLCVRQTEYKKAEIIEILLEYAENEGFFVHSKTHNKLIVNRYRTFQSAYMKTMIFFIEDNIVYYTVIQDGTRINAPSMIFYWMMRWDMRKLFRRNSTTIDTELYQKNPNK